MGFDVIIVGASHNGLVTAAYLSQAGRRVLVLERRELVGGCAVTEEDYQPAVRSSRVPRFDVQTFAERGQRRFDLIQARLVLEREQAFDVGLGYPHTASQFRFLEA